MSTILGIDVVDSTYDKVVAQSLTWARSKQSRALAFANVHVLMEAFDDSSFRACLRRFDLINPDGMPLVWVLKLLGRKNATRVYGPDCTLAMLEAAAREHVPVGFYGGSQTTLDALLENVRSRFPALDIKFAYSPPFRVLTVPEDEAVVDRIAASGAQILFVGLGCPRQELWVIDHLGPLPVVMFAVGAAFDFISGMKSQAPRWMMRSGLEWLFRLASEPKRLAGRYLKHNPRFILLVMWQLLRGRGFESI